MPPRVQILAAAALFSTGGAVIKATALTNWQVAGLRSGVAALVLLAALPAARRPWTRRIAVVGLAYAFTLISFVSANKLTTAASAIFLQSTSPLYVVFMAPLLLGERVERRDAIFLLVMGLGLVLFFVGTDQPLDSAPNPLAGNIVAASSGFSWALTVMGLRSLGRGSADEGTSALVAAVVGNVFACVLCLPFAWPLPAVSTRDWLAIAYLGVVQIGLAYVLLTAAIRRLPALEVSMLLLLEPVLNPIWAWQFHGERPNAWSLAGGAAILGATSVKALADNRARAAYTRGSLGPR
jgi:drug/metabolite transporter (DMT)-like permease